MTGDPWTTLGEVPPAELHDALIEVHWAVQFVASAGQTFVEPREDDSHRAMIWDPGLESFVGEGFAGPYPFRLSLRPEDLTLVLLDRTDEALGALPLAGVTRKEGYEWLATGLATYMGAPAPRIERPEYELPEHPVARGAPFSEGQRAQLRAISALYGSAARVLEELAGAWADASPVRCRPHHFDIVTLLSLAGAGGGDAARTVGVGMAPRGGGYDAWYWYVNLWPYPESAALPDIGGPGVWHTNGWTGAVLSGDAVVSVPAQERPRLVTDFTDAAVAAAAGLLEA